MSYNRGEYRNLHIYMYKYICMYAHRGKNPKSKRYSQR